MKSALLSACMLLQACSALKGTSRADHDLFRGDRVTLDRDFIHLDDPLFLQTKSVHGYRGKDGFFFRVPVYFSAGRQDTLRFGSSGATVKPGRSGTAGGDSASGGTFACVVDTGNSIVTGGPGDQPDPERMLVLAPRPGGNARVDLNFRCPGYDPPWGRMDTLSLVFLKKSGAEDFKETSISLPFHVSFRGPVVSILLGLGLLYMFTQVGVWIAEG